MILSMTNEALAFVQQHPILSLVALLLTGITFWIIKRKRFIDAINKLPGLPSDDLHPRYGHIASLLQTIGRIPGHPSLPLTYAWFVENCTKYTAQGHGVFRVWFFNPYRLPYARASVTVLDPDLIHQLLTKHSNKLIKETRIYNASSVFFKNSFITLPDGPTWKHQRKMTASAFHSHLLEKVSSTVDTLMTNHLFPVFDKNPNVEALGWCFRLTTEVLGIVAFSHSFNSFDLTRANNNKNSASAAGGTAAGEEQEEVGTLFDSISIMASMIATKLLSPPIFDWLPGKDNPRFVKATNKLNAVVGEVVKERLAKQIQDEASGTARTTVNKRGTDILSHLLVRDEDGTRLSYEDIYSNVKLLLFAGHDTTAVAMSWGIWEMAANPRVQKKLQQEIDSLYDAQQQQHVDDNGNNDSSSSSSLSKQIVPPYRQISRLEYLDAVVKETLRLHPPAQMARTTIEDITLEKGNGTSYTIPAGTPTYVFPFCTQTMPTYLKMNPTTFYPERFMHDNQYEKESMNVYMPFSVGPRYCVGLPMAIAELKAIYCHLLRRYWIQPQTTTTTSSNGTTTTTTPVAAPIPVMMLTAKPNQVLVTMERRQPHQ